eukprot:6195037-Pleurochrysis_carterae.AAC.1
MHVFCLRTRNLARACRARRACMQSIQTRHACVRRAASVSVASTLYSLAASLDAENVALTALSVCLRLIAKVAPSLQAARCILLHGMAEYAGCFIQIPSCLRL